MQLSDALKNPPKLLGPDYTIYHYRSGIYKVVKFKSPRQLVKPLHTQNKKAEPSEFKPDTSLSRARRNVLALALCNDWKYFATFTLDKTKYDRYNLEVWKKTSFNGCVTNARSQKNWSRSRYKVFAGAGNAL